MKSEKTNYGKIFATMLAIVMGVCAVMWFGIKLYRKYCLLEHDDSEFDSLDDDMGDDECEVVMADEEAAQEETTAEPAQAEEKSEE